MALEYRFACPLPNGLHARPASHLEAVASRFQSGVVLANERTETEVNAKSVLALIGTGTLAGDPLCLRVSGADETAAFDTLTRFLRDDFAACDAALPEASASGAGESRPWPRSLRACAPETVLTGTPASRGVAQGRLTRVGGLTLSPRLADEKPESCEREFARFQRAAAAVRERLEAARSAAHGVEAKVLGAHLSLLSDVSLADAVAAFLAAGNVTAAQAVLSAVAQFSGQLQRSGSDYLRERVLDLQDLGAGLLSEMYGEDAVTRLPVLTRATLIVAESLTPGQFLGLDRAHVKGLALQHGGATSHTIILARSFGVPTLTGVAGAGALEEGVEAVLDANIGLLLPSPNPAVRRFYALEDHKQARLRSAAAAFRDTPGGSADGQPLQILANVSSAEEVGAAIEQGAEGIGLFRTEMLFMDRSEPPSEDEQAQVYTAAARAAGGRPVVLRTFDIGGDKPVPYLALPAEQNPFLGYRGIRLYDEFAGLLRTQLRAIFRAAPHGKLKIMAPMVACPEELRAFRALVDEVRADFPAVDVPVGAMIEVPSAIFALPELCEHADFFSVGTNDLAQYFLATDRDNARVSPLNTWTHPAFLRLLQMAANGARAGGRPLGLCGEMGGNTEAQAILLGLGFESVSMAAPQVLRAKAALARRTADHCRTLAGAVLAAATRTAVEALLRDFQAEGDQRPVIAADMISLDSQAASKAEAIKELADLLEAGGRTSDAVAVEEAVWAREEAYSTGFGHGFAVPHCKSAHVTANTLALVRLRTPVDWGSLDGGPVRVAILLAIRDADHGKEHLRLFSRLSRLMMREEFRARLETAADADAVLAAFREELLS